MSVQFGEPKGVKVGDVFASRQALVDAGLHRTIQRGIDGNGSEGSSAIVLSGGYEDDLDFGDVIFYTGEGGNDNGKQVAHQSFDSPGNAGLLKSYQLKLPIRVIRSWNHDSPFSPKSGYMYCGLYEIVEEPKRVIGKSGKYICRYKLRMRHSEPIDVKVGSIATIKTSSVANEMIYAIGERHPHIKTIASTSGLAKKLIGKSIGDSFEFGPNVYEVIDVFEYLS